MKRIITMMLVAVLAIAVAVPALATSVPNQVNPQQMGYPAYLEAVHGKEEAQRILKEIHSPKVPYTTTTTPIFPGYLGAITTPTAVYFPAYSFTVIGTPQYYGNVEVATAKMIAGKYVSDNWDATIFGDIDVRFTARYGFTVDQMIDSYASNGYIHQTKLNDVLAKIDAVVANPAM